MATPWSDFRHYVTPHVPGVFEGSIDTHLQEAAAEFCAKSHIWRQDIDVETTNKDTSDYELGVPDRTVLEDILVLQIEEDTLRRVSDRHYALPSSKSRGRPSAFTIYQDTQVRLYPTPDDRYKLSGVMVVKPALNATGVEDWIFETYGRAIASGAVYRMAIAPQTSWSNPALADYHMREFYKGITEARGRDTRRANATVLPVGFDGVVRRGGMI